MKKYVQQIMLGTVTGNESQARQTLKRIKAAGYDGLELNQFMIHPGSLLVRILTRAAGMPTGNGGKLQWRDLIIESGLEVVSLHTDLGSLEKDAAAAVEEAKSFGAERLVITGLYRFDYSEEKAVKKLAARLNQVGEAVSAAGGTLLYHNHNAELQRVNRTQRAYDILIEDTDPSLLGFEFDNYWFTDGGADASLWMKRLGMRMKLWHINDRGHRGSGPYMTPILKCDSMELGTGNMDLDRLWDIALENETESVILESHKNWIDKDPVKSLELSAAWLSRQ